MSTVSRKHVALLMFALVGATSAIHYSHPRNQNAAPWIPRTWDDAAIATLEVPLADPVGSPKHVSAEYYYRIPVRPIYKTYPIYAPGHEPLGNMEMLQRQDPQVLWDDRGHAPPLKTDADCEELQEAVKGASRKLA